MAELEAVLIVAGALDVPDRPPPKDGDDSEDEFTTTNARHKKNVRKTKDGSDSEFEFDV